MIKSSKKHINLASRYAASSTSPAAPPVAVFAAAPLLSPTDYFTALLADAFDDPPTLVVVDAAAGKLIKYNEI